MLPRDEFYDVAAGDLALLRVVVRALAKRLRKLVSERPEEARIEGEGVEQPDALDEAKTNPLVIETSPSPASEVASAPTQGESLTAAALGQTEGVSESESVSESDAPTPPSEPAMVSGEIITPEPLVPVGPQAGPQSGTA
jgi:hypothetical protein